MDKVILITSRAHHQQPKFLLLDILLMIPEPPRCIMAYSASLFFIVDPFLFKKNYHFLILYTSPSSHFLPPSIPSTSVPPHQHQLHREVKANCFEEEAKLSLLYLG